jgi:hypothetical protein
MPLWVINCPAISLNARQKDPRKPARRHATGAAETGQSRRFAPQKSSEPFSVSDHREVGHRPADWGVLSFAMIQCA